MDEGFQEFWYRYPIRVGKLAAIKAYTKARRLATDADILAGVERYIRMKPSYAAWAHPSSWLNAGRWMDEGTALPTERYSEWTCPHETKCLHPTRCRTLQAIAAEKAKAS